MPLITIKKEFMRHTSITLLSAVLLAFSSAVTAQDTEETKNINLKEVVVSASLNPKDATKESFIITDSLRRNTNNALQLIGKLNGITVDMGTDEVNIGKDRNVPVMVNGRDMGEEYARSINPKRIQKVEILRYPKGRYGDAPIVMNIVLSGNYTGWDIDVHNKEMLSAENKHSYNTTTGAAFTYSLQRWNIYGNAGFTAKKIYEATAYEYVYKESASEKTQAADANEPNMSNADRKGNFSIGTDFMVAKGHTLSVQAWTEWRRNNAREAYKEEKSDVSMENNDGNYDALDFTAGLFYNGNIRNRLRLTSDLTFNTYHVDEDRTYSRYSDLTLQNTKGRKNYWRYNGEATYIWNSLITSTLGYTFIHRDYSDKDRNVPEDVFNSDETRHEGYASLSVRPYRSLDITGGLRMLGVNSENNTTSLSDLSFMPVIKLWWQPIRKVSLSADYYSDVAYPNLDDMSPVGYQVNSIVWHRGNPNLKARIMKYLELRLDLAGIVKFTYMLKRSSNDMTPWYITGDDGVTETYTGSRYRHQYVGVEGDYKLPLNLRLNITANYQWYRRNASGNADTHTGRTWYIGTQLAWNAGKAVNVVAQYFLRHDKLPLLQGTAYNEEEMLAIGAMTSLLKRKLSIALMLTIPTNAISKDTYTKIDMPEFSSIKTNNHRVNRTLLQLNMRLNIGNGRASKKTNTYVNDKEKPE